MNLFLSLAFLFCLGSLLGWVIEFVFRRITNPEKKWINPGFCAGPYLPLYGFGLICLYLLVSAKQYLPFSHPVVVHIVLFAGMALCLTAVEYIAGLLCLKCAHVRLWDYRNERGNLQGIICPRFTLAWTAIGVIYYFFLHRFFQQSIDWLQQHPSFSFFIGLFYGCFLIDVVHSAQLIAKLKAYADENDVIVKFEMLKSAIRAKYEESKKKYHFFLPFRSDLPLNEHLKNLRLSFEKRKRPPKK